MKKLYSHFHPVIFCIILSINTLFSAHVYSQPADSLIFRDDFNRSDLGSFWVAAPSWSIVNGNAYNYTEGPGGILKTTADYTDSSYIIETTAKGFTNNYMRDFRITFGQQDLANDSTYVLRFSLYDGGRLTLSRSSNDIYSPALLDEIVVYPGYNAVQYYKFKIARYKSGLIQIYTDMGAGYSAIPVLEAIDTVYKTLGHTGWQVDTQSNPEDFFVDWFTAYIPSDEKPAEKEKPAEDNLITQVSAGSNSVYQVTKLNKGTAAFTDRNYTITSLPPYLKGASFIQTACNDKKNTTNDLLTFFLKKDAIVYVAYDSRATALPAWLDGFAKTRDSIITTDAASGYLTVYSKLFEYGNIYPRPLILGGNLAAPASGAMINYLVAAVEKPDAANLQAEDASLSGAVVATDHTGYTGTGFVDYKNTSNDFIEWTVQVDIPGTYELSFRFSNGKSADRTLLIEDNDSGIGAVTFSTNYNWNTWSTISGPKVYLSAGMHKIKALAAGTSGPNIDELSVIYSSSAVSNITADKPASSQYVSHYLQPSYKAFPNPFTGNTAIYFSLPEKAHVSLSIYSATGQKLQVLVNGSKEAGSYQAIFKGINFLPGMYIYQLEIGNKIISGKLLKE